MMLETNLSDVPCLIFTLVFLFQSPCCLESFFFLVLTPDCIFLLSTIFHSLSWWGDPYFFVTLVHDASHFFYNHVHPVASLSLFVTFSVSFHLCLDPASFFSIIFFNGLLTWCRHHLFFLLHNSIHIKHYHKRGKLF